MTKPPLATLDYADCSQSIPAAWNAVYALAFCVAVLIASEFMPVSLLSPIAFDLGVTEGRTGQAISISGIFAVLTSLLVSTLTRRVDRRVVLISFCVILVVSGGLVAFAASYKWFIAGRALLGIAVGGFWSISTATIMRLVPEASVPTALAILNMGNAVAATIAAPLASLLAGYISWRGAFFAVVPLGLLSLVWTWFSLPALPPKMRGSRPLSVMQLLARKPVAFGIASIMLLFAGQFALFTYLRPFLEHVTGLTVPSLSFLLLLMGLAGVIGTYLISGMLRTRLFSILIILPLGMAALALALIAYGAFPTATSLLLVGWGLVGTAAPVAWGTWLTKTMPDDAETGGGLQVATIQFAIAIGASMGGALFDSAGWQATFVLAAAALVGSAVLAVLAWHSTGRP